MAYSDRVFNRSLGELSTLGSGALTGQGGADIGQAGDFFRTLLGGSRQQIMQQASPSLNLAGEQAAGARQSAARAGTGRTGGGAAEQAQQQDAIQKAFDTMVGQQQATAADKLANIGSTELQTMMNALNIGGSLAQADVASRRAASAQMWSSLIGGASSIATGGMLGGFKNLFGGGAKTTPTTSTGTPAWQGPIQPPAYNLSILQPPVFPLPQQSPAGWDWSQLGR